MSTTQGSTMCGIVLEDGSDCQNDVYPDAPMNLCISHLAEAAAWFNSNAGQVRPVGEKACPVCGELELRVEESGVFCGNCHYASDGFAGVRRLTDVERDETYTRLGLGTSGPRPLEVVYYVRFRDRIKIGTTRRPRERLQSIPHEEVLAFERGDARTEAHRHLEFREHRVGKTEWFTMAPELLAHIDRLNEGVTDPWDWYRKLIVGAHNTP